MDIAAKKNKLLEVNCAVECEVITSFSTMRCMAFPRANTVASIYGHQQVCSSVFCIRLHNQPYHTATITFSYMYSK